jgi:hypothetical protein
MRFDQEIPMTQDGPARSSRWAFPFLVFAIAAGCLMYRILVLKRLEQSALLFVGIPALLAVVVACTPKAKTLIGGTLKVTTLFLLLSAPLLGEGFICILMAAPIFYAVAVGIAAIITVVQTSAKNRKQNILPCLALIGIMPMALEGSRPALSFNRQEAVTARRVVHATPEEVEAALSQSPRTNLSIPLFFKSFPRPTEAHGAGLKPGDLRSVHFAGGEGHPGDVVLRVVESQPGHTRFAAVSDQSKIAHWLAWDYADVRWRPVDATHTQVEWTLAYRRLLDPAWYFRPWERYAVRVSADYLIRANATPEGRE